MPAHTCPVREVDEKVAELERQGFRVVQVAFTPAGDAVVVTERVTIERRLSTSSVSLDGWPV